MSRSRREWPPVPSDGKRFDHAIAHFAFGADDEKRRRALMDAMQGPGENRRSRAIEDVEGSGKE